MGPKKLTWVTEQATDSSSRFIAGRGVGRTKDEHKKVRKHAAQSSAATRLATMRRKQHDEIMEVVRKHYTALESGSLGLRKSEDVPPPWFINRLLAESSWYQTAVQMNSLGQKSTRNILWGAITHNTALLQVGFLVAGTHTNSCGIPPGKLVHMGPALVHLRTASLQSVQSAIESSVRDSLTAVAVALLAGWERSSRHGDESAYEMHMSAWRQMKHPPTTEEERNVDTLCDAVWKLFKENLDELSAITSASPSSSRPQYPATLPPGFRIFSLARPETRSLLDVASRVSAVEPTILGSLSQIRELCLQGISWSVSHSVSVGLEACPAHEEGWDHLEIQALYHIRAALISLNGVLHMVASKTHRVHWSEYHIRLRSHRNLTDAIEISHGPPRGSPSPHNVLPASRYRNADGNQVCSGRALESIYDVCSRPGSGNRSSFT